MKEIIEKYLKQFNSKNTKRMYKIHLKQYFEIIGADPDTYFDNNRNYEADVQAFSNTINKDSPKSQKAKISCVRSFLIEHDVEIRERVWRSINRRRNGNGVITIDKVPDPADLKKILHYSTSKSKTLFLALASSGMRISEVIGITWDDINFDNNPVEITIPANLTKNGSSRITFITNEATEALKEWQKEREGYLKRACAKSRHSLNITKSINDERVFPIAINTANEMWSYMVERAGSPYNERDARTGRHKYHIHSLRKFFRTQLSLGTGNPDIAETLMGHKGYLTDSYRRVSEKELAMQYKKGMNHLLVFTNVDLIKGYTTELENRQNSMNVTIANQYTALKGIEQKYETEIQKLREENKILQDNFARILRRMDELMDRKDEEIEKAEISARLNKKME